MLVSCDEYHGHADLADRLVPTPVSPHLLGGARVGRCHGLTEEHALSFAMGSGPAWRLSAAPCLLAPLDK